MFHFIQEFSLISKLIIKPLNYAGMLMEMHITAIQRLLDSPTDLQKAVNRAVDTLNADAARK